MIWASKDSHATRRYHGSGHPIVASFESGENWHRCYVDEALL